MKPIVIATDFSEASRYAFEYGVILADRLGVAAHLVHCYLPGITAEEKKTGTHVRKQLNKLVSSLSFSPAVPITVHAIQGEACSSITQLARELQADMVIAGMKGEGKTKPGFIGSTSLTLSRTCKVPLLVVPEGCAYVDPTVIALASDKEHKGDIHILDPLVELGQHFESIVYIVKVIKKQDEHIWDMLLKPSRMKAYLRTLKASFEFVSDQDVAHALNEFVDQHEVRMVVMIAREHSIVEKIVSQSSTRDMMFTTNVPLLILPQYQPGNSRLKKNRSAKVLPG